MEDQIKSVVRVFIWGKNPLPLEGVRGIGFIPCVLCDKESKKFKDYFFHGFWASESASRALSTIFWEAVTFGFIIE